MPRRRIRRPLLALLVLVAALLIGYAVRAAQHDGHHRPPAVPSTSSPRP